MAADENDLFQTHFCNAQNRGISNSQAIGFRNNG